MGAATIRIFVADGTPHGIRILDKSSWTGRRSEPSGLMRVYVGEADLLATRDAT